MDETIGAKGGKNDRRRSLIIKKNRKKKLIEDRKENEIKELERKVKKQQRYTLIKALPIAIGGEIVRTIHDVAQGKGKKDLEEENSSWRIKEYDADITAKTPFEAEVEKVRKKIITMPNGQKVIIYAEPVIKDNIKVDDDKKENDIVISTVYPKEKDKKEKFSFTGVLTQDREVKNSNDVHYEGDVDFSGIDKESKEQLEKVKSRRIVSEYEKILKDLRFDLRNIVYEYNVLLEDENDIKVSKDAQLILDRLSVLIEKIEELKNRIKVDNIEEYDDNYVYYLIQGYLAEFKDKNVIKEIKDSPLYIMISEKLDEIDKKKDDLEKKVSDKKEKLDDKEEKFNKLKDNYYSIDRLNEELSSFQATQERLLRDLKDKIANAKSIKEKVYYELDYMNNQTTNLLRFSTLQLLIPGPRFIKGLFMATSMHRNFIRNIIRPKVKTTKYKVVEVEDYASEIKSSISGLDNAIDLLNKTSKDIDSLIYELKEKYGEYSGVISEYDSMLNNLYRIRKDVFEKEYEMERLKAQQEKQLEINNAKVLSRGSYPVN